MEAFSKFLESLPPLLQLVLGAITAAGVFWCITKYTDWSESRKKKK